MSAVVNKVIAATSGVGSSDFDEETWLLEPPRDQPTAQSNDSCESSVRIVDWLQGAALNVDFQTRSALSRRLASQAAKKKRRAEKLLERSYHSQGEPCLAKVQEELADLTLASLTDSESVELNDSQEMNKTEVNVLEKNIDKYQCQIGRLDESSLEQNRYLGSEIELQINQQMASTPDDDDEFFDANSEFTEASMKLSCDSRVTTHNESHEKHSSTGINKKLAAVNECVEISSLPDAVDKSCNSSSQANSFEAVRSARQANTARVLPTVVKNAHCTPRLFGRSIPSDFKLHSPSSHPDLNDIRHIVERQETELREELRQRKSFSQGENCKTLRSNPKINAQLRCARAATTLLASSRSVDFCSDNVKKSLQMSSPSPTTLISRLPTPVRKSVGNGRSFIPTPRALLVKSAVRGVAGGSTPSLSVPTLNVLEETKSECGSTSNKDDQQWSEDCF